MQSYHKPEVYNVPEPHGLDAQIAVFQRKLSNISWLQVIYGRAYKQYAEYSNPKDTEIKNNRAQFGFKQIYFPETWGKNYEPVNCMPNDNVKAQAFFMTRDPGNQANDNNTLPNQVSVKQPISVIVWANLKKIDPDKKYRFSEELKAELGKWWAKVPAFQFTQFYEDYNKVFEGFTLTEDFTKYIKPPYWAIRIDGYLSYDLLECGCLGESVCFTEDNGDLACVEMRL